VHAAAQVSQQAGRAHRLHPAPALLQARMLLAVPASCWKGARPAAACNGLMLPLACLA
jgi:hypothetical protein